MGMHNKATYSLAWAYSLSYSEALVVGPLPPLFGPSLVVRGVGGLVLFRLGGGGVGGGVSVIGVRCVLCFFDPVLVVYVHSVRPGKMLRTGGCIVWNCGPGVLWIPSRISRSLCIIPLVILGCAYRGGFGAYWVRGSFSCPSHFGLLPLGHNIL